MAHAAFVSVALTTAPTRSAIMAFSCHTDHDRGTTQPLSPPRTPQQEDEVEVKALVLLMVACVVLTPASASSGDGGPLDGGVSPPIVGRCERVRSDAYRRSMRAHVLVKFGLEFERCALPNTEVLRFEIWVGGQSTVRFQSGTKDQMACVRRVLSRIVLPTGVRQSFEFRFDGKPSLHDPLTFAEIADAGGGGGLALGFCENDGDCWPTAVCSCSSDRCATVSQRAGPNNTRGVCVSFDALSCVQELNHWPVGPR